MAVSLAEAQVNCQDDVDFAVIDTLRRYSWLLDQIQFDQAVNPAGGGATLTYGYTRLVTAAAAAFRAVNSEYVAGVANRDRFTVDLKPLGGSFEVDRVLAALGQAATNEVAFQLDQLVKSIRTKFQDEFINGDDAVDVNGFDGLDKALTGSSTEYLPIDNGVATGYLDWTATTVNTSDEAHGALDVLDEFLSLLLFPADAILGNTKSITRVRALGRRAGFYTREEDSLGRMIERYGNAVLIDIGDNAAGSAPIIPIETRDPDGGGAGGNITGLTDLYAVNFGLDTMHGVSTPGQLVQTWKPDFTTAGAVKKGEAEMGPVAMVLKNTKGAAVLRNVKVS